MLSDRLVREATAQSLAFREIDLGTLHVIDGKVADAAGPVHVTHLAPGTTYGEPEGASAVAELERCGVRVLNTAAAAAAADDKIATARLLDAHGVTQPDWTAVAPDRLDDALAVGLPLVLKRPAGALGTWNRLVTTPDELLPAALELFAEGVCDLLAQQAITESFGTSIRVVVLGDQVLAATQLRAQPGEWRSNGALGATGTGIELDEQGSRLAVAAPKALGLGYAGVDLIPTRAGFMVLEVNAASPFDGAERRTGCNIAHLLITALLKR
jgi:ribosomal protein S6--L-glutamate ligase